MGIYSASWLSTKKDGSSFMAHSLSCGPDSMSLGTLGQAMTVFSVPSCFRLQTTTTTMTDDDDDDEQLCRTLYQVQVFWTSGISSWSVTQTTPLLAVVGLVFVFSMDQPAPRSISCFCVLSPPTDWVPGHSKRCIYLQKPSPCPFLREASLPWPWSPALVRPLVGVSASQRYLHLLAAAEITSACFPQCFLSQTPVELSLS